MSENIETGDDRMKSNREIYRHDIVYRPPLEVDSVLLEVTVGCTYGKCGFCACACQKKNLFQIISIDELRKNIVVLSKDANNRKKAVIFFLGFNAFALDTGLLLERFNIVHEFMPWIKKINMYARAQDVLKKSRKELEQLKRSGLGELHIGLESGSDVVLQMCNKGETSDEMLKCFKILDFVGIPYNLSAIVGLGGRKNCWIHATQTAELCNKVHPKSLRVMALTIWPGSPLEKEKKEGRFIQLTPKEEILEQRLLLEKLEVDNCLLDATHLSNSVPVRGYLMKDKEDMMDEMDRIICYSDLSKIRKPVLTPTSGW